MTEFIIWRLHIIPAQPGDYLGMTEKIKFRNAVCTHFLVPSCTYHVQWLDSK